MITAICFVNKEIYIMIQVCCKTIRETKPNQIEVGKKYWIDETTKYTDPDGDEFVVVYTDKEGTHEIGSLSMKHFEVI